MFLVFSFQLQTQGAVHEPKTGQAEQRHLCGSLAVPVRLAVVAVAIMGSRRTSRRLHPLRPSIRVPPSLTVAYSPEKAALMRDLGVIVQRRRQKTPDRQAMAVQLVEVTPEEMVNQALADSGGFQALTPDSSLWIDQLEQPLGAEPARGRSPAPSSRG